MCVPCMAMTSNYLLRAECQRRHRPSNHPVRIAGGSGKTTGQKRDRLFELPLPPRPFYSIPPSVPWLLHECNKGRAHSMSVGRNVQPVRKKRKLRVEEVVAKVFLGSFEFLPKTWHTLRGGGGVCF